MASRSTLAAKTLYEGMRAGGVLMSDGYEPYAAIAEQHRFVHLGCWAHCRRYFHEALQALPKDRRGPEQLPARFLASSSLSAACTRSRPRHAATRWAYLTALLVELPKAGTVEDFEALLPWRLTTPGR